MSDEVDRCYVVKSVIECLPGWFILPYEAEEYSEKAKDCIVFAAYLETTAIGFIEIKIKNAHVAEVLAMGVICGYHHLGMGHKLMEAAIEECAQLGIRILEVKTADYSDPDEKYIATRKFYEKMDFEALDTFEHYWADGTPVLIMVRKIEPAVKPLDLTFLA